MKIILLSIFLAAVLTLAGCGGTVMTPEYIDPSDTLSSSEEAVIPPSSAPAPESAPLPEPSEEAEESSETAPEVRVEILSDMSPLWEQDGISCSRYSAAFTADTAGASGSLVCDFLQISGFEGFNTWWKDDLTGWEISVNETVRANAQLAAEYGEQALPYSIELPAEVTVRGGIVSVRRKGVQTVGEEQFSFMSNRCFDRESGQGLELWDLFTVPESESAPVILAALDQQSEEMGLPFAGSSLFAPTDFSLSDTGILFSLTTAEGIIDLEIPYGELEGILAYDLAE